MNESTAIYLIFGTAGRRGGYPLRPSSGLSKPTSASKRVGEGLRNVPRRRERSAGLLLSNGEGVVETDAAGLNTRRVGGRKCGREAVPETCS